MNGYTMAAIFCAGVIVGIGIMIWLIVRGHKNAMAAFQTPPEK